MRVLLITENLGSGGAEHQLVGLAALLQERGYDVVVLTYLKGQFYEPFLKEHNVKYIFDGKLLNKYMRVLRLARVIKRLSPNIVISFLPAVNTSVGLVRLFNHKFNLIVSERSHTLIFNLKTYFQFWLYNKTAQYVVTNSVSEANNLKRHYPSLSNKIRTISNFVNTADFCPVDNLPNNSSLRILCVGRIIASKNVLLFVEAIKKLIDEGFSIKCKWVGSMYDSLYTQKVKNKMQELALADVIELADQTNDIVSEYQQADIFCMPSLLEGYPNVLVEAMSCALPVVCSDVYENSYIVNEGENGFLFNPHDIDGIVNALKKMLLLTVDERIIMGLHNREQIIHDNSPVKFVTQYIKLFD